MSDSTINWFWELQIASSLLDIREWCHFKLIRQIWYFEIHRLPYLTVLSHANHKLLWKTWFDPILLSIREPHRFRIESLTKRLDIRDIHRLWESHESPTNRLDIRKLHSSLQYTPYLLLSFFNFFVISTHKNTLSLQISNLQLNWTLINLYCLNLSLFLVYQLFLVCHCDNFPPRWHFFQLIFSQIQTKKLKPKLKITTQTKFKHPLLPLLSLILSLAPISVLLLSPDLRSSFFFQLKILQN